MGRINLTVYLAGAMQGLTKEEMSKWRDIIGNSLMTYCAYSDGSCNLRVINPLDYFNFDETRFQTDMEVMKFDLQCIEKSNLVIVNVSRLNTSIGSSIEVYEAWKRGTPVIAYDENNEYESLHPWIKNCITRVDRTVSDLCGYIYDFYMV